MNIGRLTLRRGAAAAAAASSRSTATATTTATLVARFAAPHVAHLNTTAATTTATSTTSLSTTRPHTPITASSSTTPPVSRPCRLRSSSLHARRRRFSTSSSSSSNSSRSLSPAPLPALHARRSFMQGAIAAAATMPMQHMPFARLWPSGNSHDVDDVGEFHGVVDGGGGGQQRRQRAAADADAAAHSGDASAQSIVGSAAGRLLRGEAPAILTPKQSLRDKAFLQFDVGTAAFPHPNRVRTGSEDAFFTSRRTGSFVSSGVADGVASVRMKYGLDPSKFSRALCDGAHGLSNERLGLYSLDSLPTPPEMFDAAVDHARSNNVKGCATLTVLTLNGYLDEMMDFDPKSPAGELSALSLGDSQFMVIHNDMITHKAYFQQHNFGHPYQLGNGEGLQNDSLDEAIHTSMPVHSGDTVIIGSDGLFDNVHDAELLAMTLESDNLQRSASQLATQLANFAYERSTDRDADTPYSVAASKHLELPFSGGNRDDITVVVTKVHDLPNSSLF